MWQLLCEGRQVVCESEEEGVVVWAGLALSFFLICRASELFAHDDTKLVHPEFCLTRRYLTFRQGSLILSWQDRERADRVEMMFRAPKADQTRRGATITRTRLSTSHEAGRGGAGWGCRDHTRIVETAPVVANGRAVDDESSRGESGEYYTSTSHSSLAAHGGKSWGWRGSEVLCVAFG